MLTVKMNCPTLDRLKHGIIQERPKSKIKQIIELIMKGNRND